MIKCACEHEECAITAKVDIEKKFLEIDWEKWEDNGRPWVRMYLDANSTVELIRELWKLLASFCEVEE